jgi:hypothetical protein
MRNFRSGDAKELRQDKYTCRKLQPKLAATSSNPTTGTQAKRHAAMAEA